MLVQEVESNGRRNPQEFIQMGVGFKGGLDCLPFFRNYVRHFSDSIIPLVGIASIKITAKPEQLAVILITM